MKTPAVMVTLARSIDVRGARRDTAARFWDRQIAAEKDEAIASPAAQSGRQERLFVAAWRRTWLGLVPAHARRPKDKAKLTLQPSVFGFLDLRF
jgi:hypothetical protein